MIKKSTGDKRKFSNFEHLLENRRTMPHQISKKEEVVKEGGWNWQKNHFELQIKTVHI